MIVFLPVSSFLSFSYLGLLCASLSLWFHRLLIVPLERQHTGLRALVRLELLGAVALLGQAHFQRVAFEAVNSLELLARRVLGENVDLFGTFGWVDLVRRGLVLALGGKPDRHGIFGKHHLHLF